MDRSIRFLAFVALLISAHGCVSKDKAREQRTVTPEAAAASDKASLRADVDAVHCPPYGGTDTQTIHVVALDPPHIMPNRETYYTFRYNEAELLNPACLSLGYGKLCKCDIVSQSVGTSIPCSDGTYTSVTMFVFKTGALMIPGTECPDRNAKH